MQKLDEIAKNSTWERRKGMEEKKVKKELDGWVIK